MQGASGQRHSKPDNPEARAARPPGSTLWTRPEPRASSPAVGKDSCWTGGVTAPSGPQHRSRGDGYPHGPGQLGGLSVLTLRLEKNLFKLAVLLSWPSLLTQISHCHPFRRHWGHPPRSACHLSRGHFRPEHKCTPNLAPPSTGCVHWLPQSRSWLGYRSGYFYHCTLNPVLTFETFLSH